MNIAITGGTGFLGSAIVRHLVAQGDAVRLIVRPTSRTGQLPAGVTTQVVDLLSADDVRRALAGMDAVVHAAALVTNWGHPWADFQRINVEAPAVVCEAAAAAGVRAAVYVSSFLALGPSDGTGAVNEDTVHDPRHCHNHYERSKMLGDQRVRELIARGLPVVVVYPGMLYGPGPRTQGNYVARLLDEFVAGRVPGIIGSGAQRWSFAHVDDVARGVRLALAAHLLEKGDTIRMVSPTRYVLGGENVSIERLFALLGELTGTVPPRRRIGRRLAWLAALVEECRARLTGRVPTFTRDAAAIFAHDWACDSTAAIRDLGYTIRPLAEGLRDCVQ